MNNNLYPIYPIKTSDKGFYFKKSEAGDEYYLNAKSIIPQGWQASCLLSLGAGELYVISGQDKGGKTQIWFLNRKLNLLSYKGLLFDPNFKDTLYAQLWQSYLKDVTTRIWYTLITPNLIYTHSDFSPSKLFISLSVSVDFKYVLNSVIETCKVFNVKDKLPDFFPTISRKYVTRGLASNSTYIEHWQDKAISKGYVEVISPFSGKVIKSNKSFLFWDGFVTGYLFEDQGECFFLITSGHQNTKDAFLFPRKNILITNKTPKPNQKNSFQSCVPDFYLSILHDWHLVKPYLLSASQKAVVTTGRETHIGHYLWNELSGLARAENHDALKNVSHHYVQNNNDHFGPIDILFPNLTEKVIRLDKPVLPQLVYQNNYFYVKPGDAFISVSLAEKIIAYSSLPAVVSCCSKELQTFDKENFFITILFTLRIGNRSWLDQETGICEIIARLARHYEQKITLIIDGHNTSSLGARLKSYREDLTKEQTGLDMFEEEYQMAERIKAVLSSDKVKVINTIGCSVQESINWSLLCDFFVAPWGAGLAKYKWVTNTPGLVFSSNEVLTTKPDLHIYDNLQTREGTYPCEYLDLSAINDIDEISITGHYRNNFTLSIDALYKKIAEMCERYGRATKSTKILNKH